MSTQMGESDSKVAAITCQPLEEVTAVFNSFLPEEKKSRCSQKVLRASSSSSLQSSTVFVRRGIIIVQFRSHLLRLLAATNAQPSPSSLCAHKKEEREGGSRTFH